jgi:hypothetical protein
VQANEISLIEGNELPHMTAKLKERAVDKQQESVLEDEDDEQEDDLSQVDDFINKENNKLKDIKLLNLDLERAGLELKRKEIEQKISQLNKTEGTVPLSFQETSVDVKPSRPLVKLVGIFESAMKKQAMLSINGQRRNVKEGQDIEGIVIKAIQSQAITIQYQDGQVQDIYLL